MNTKLVDALTGRVKVTRREFMKAALATGISIAAAERLYVTAARAQPKKGGTFRVGLGSGATTDTLDPATWPDTFNGLFGWGTLGASLTEVQADGKIMAMRPKASRPPTAPRRGSSACARAPNSTTARPSRPKTWCNPSTITAAKRRSPPPSRS